MRRLPPEGYVCKACGKGGVDRHWIYECSKLKPKNPKTKEDSLCDIDSKDAADSGSDSSSDSSSDSDIDSGSDGDMDRDRDADGDSSSDSGSKKEGKQRKPRYDCSSPGFHLE